MGKYVQKQQKIHKGYAVFGQVLVVYYQWWYWPHFPLTGCHRKYMQHWQLRVTPWTASPKEQTNRDIKIGFCFLFTLEDSWRGQEHWTSTSLYAGFFLFCFLSHKWKAAYCKAGVWLGSLFSCVMWSPRFPCVHVICFCFHLCNIELSVMVPLKQSQFSEPRCSLFHDWKKCTNKATTWK